MADPPGRIFYPCFSITIGYDIFQSSHTLFCRIQYALHVQVPFVVFLRYNQEDLIKVMTDW